MRFRPTREQALEELLLTSFDVGEMEVFLRHGPGGTELHAMLPSRDTAPLIYVGQAVRAMEQRGLVDAAFFERLLEVRPNRRSDIEAVQARWGEESPPGKISVHSRPHLHLGWIAALVSVLAIIGTAVFAVIPREGRQTDEPGFPSWLETQGYILNPGLSPTFLPGNVVQTMEPGPDGSPRSLAVPVPFLRRSDCFPGQSPERQPANPARPIGDITSLLSLEDPGLQATPEGLHVLGFAKSDLNQQFSGYCNDAMARASAAGDHVEWFSVVVEAWVADAIRFTATDGAAADLLPHLQILFPQATEIQPGQAEVRVTGPFVLAWRARPLGLVSTPIAEDPP